MTSTCQDKIRIAVWWSLPCKATAGIFRELANIPNISVDIYLLHDISEERKILGWQFPEYGEASVLLLPEDKEAQNKFLDEFCYNSYQLHLLNSAYMWPQFNYVIDRLIEKEIKFGILTEAPFNAFKGAKRFLKMIYTRTLLIFRVQRRAKYAAFVCSLSGEALDARANLERMGFDAENIYRFGYFTEQSKNSREIEKPLNSPILFLCVGYITENKGQLILVEALRQLRARTPILFKCVITGFGPIMERIKEYIHLYKMEDIVELTGPVPDHDLLELYNNADIFLAPGIEEPWGIRINEAIQAGIPVVMSDRIGAAELLVASHGGEIFESGNISSLVKTLESILNSPSRIGGYQNNLIHYRPRIHPREAAKYLNAVIEHVLVDGPKPGKPGWV